MQREWAFGCGSPTPGRAQPPPAVPRAGRLWDRSGLRQAWPHVPGQLHPLRSPCHFCLRLPRALSPPPIGCGQVDKGGKLPAGLRAKSPSLSEPVGQEHHRRKRGPRRLGPAKLPSPPLRGSTRWGRGAPATPGSSPLRALQGPQIQPGPKNILKACQTILCHLYDHTYDSEHQTWVGPGERPGNRPSPLRRTLTALGNQGLSPQSAQPCLQHPQYQASDPWTRLRPSTVRSPHLRGGSKDPTQPLSPKRSL